jgi:hypothetical protein
MAKTAWWQQPASDKGSAAAEEKELKGGKASIPMPRDGDFIRAGKIAGIGYAGNATAIVSNSDDNPKALATRITPNHDYKLTDYGAGTAQSRVELQNKLAAKGYKGTKG